MDETYCPFCMKPLAVSDTVCPSCGEDLSGYQALSHHLPSGTILQGRYLVGRFLGEGGFGITYIGRDLTLQRRVAIKEYFPVASALRDTTVSLDVTNRYTSQNEAFNKGLIPEETFRWNHEQYMRKLSDGTVLGVFDQNWNIAPVNDALYTSVKFENTYLALPLVYDPEYVDGREIEEHYMNGAVMNKDRGFGISVTCPYPERLIAMMETFLSDEWQLLFQWGIEGEDYYVDENGRMRMTLEQFLAQADPQWKLANRAAAIWEGCPKKQGTMDDGNAWTPIEQREIYYDQMTNYDKEFLAACGKELPVDFFNPPIELAPYGEAWQIDKDPIDMDYMDFEQIEDERLPEIIMCDPAELDAAWDDFTEEIAYSAGVYTDYMQQEILKLVEKAAE